MGRGHLCDFLVPIQQVSFPGLTSLCNPHTGHHTQFVGAELNFKVHSFPPQTLKPVQVSETWLMEAMPKAIQA